jgi:hypothetical protein
MFSESGLYPDVSAPNPINRPVTAADKEYLIDSNESHRLLRKSVDDCDEFFFCTYPSGLQHPLVKRHFFSIYETGFTVTCPTRSTCIRGVTLPGGNIPLLLARFLCFVRNVFENLVFFRLTARCSRAQWYPISRNRATEVHVSQFVFSSTGVFIR